MPLRPARGPPRPGAQRPHDPLPVQGRRLLLPPRGGRERGLDLRGADRRRPRGCAATAASTTTKADAWFVEDERVFGKLRDPYHRVDVFESSRPVTVTAGGEVIARSDRAKLLFETGLPAGRVRARRRRRGRRAHPAEKRTTCPYKGEARYWDVSGIADGAWSYETPLSEAAGRGAPPRVLPARASRSRSTSPPTASRSAKPESTDPRGFARRHGAIQAPTSRRASSAPRRRPPSAGGRGRPRRPSRA